MGIRIVTNTDQIHQQIQNSNNPMMTSQRNDTSSPQQQGGNSAIVLTSGPEIVSGLYIETVRPKDAGTYTCAPSNARNYSVVIHVIKGKKLYSYGNLSLVPELRYRYSKRERYTKARII